MQYWSEGRQQFLKVAAGLWLEQRAAARIVRSVHNVSALRVACAWKNN
jgi:hypothetical protein